MSSLALHKAPSYELLIGILVCGICQIGGIMLATSHAKGLGTESEEICIFFLMLAKVNESTHALVEGSFSTVLGKLHKQTKHMQGTS